MRSLRTQVTPLTTDNVSSRFLDVLPHLISHSTVQTDFVRTVRAVEDILGVRSELGFVSDGNITATLQKISEVGNYSDEVKSVLWDSAPVLLQMILEYGTPDMLLEFLRPGQEEMTTKYVFLLSM